MNPTNSPAVIVLGGKEQTGCYVLRLRVKQSLAISFGRFQGGQPILVPPGEFVYIGSAMAVKGSTSLARRLLRHATRANNRPPHAIRETILKLCHKIGLGPTNLQVPIQKRLFWNIDYLLQETAVDLTQVYILRTAVRIEKELAQILESDPHTIPLVPGLGAADNPGQTHLLRVKAPAGWWKSLPVKIGPILKIGPITNV